MMTKSAPSVNLQFGGRAVSNTPKVEFAASQDILSKAEQLLLDRILELHLSGLSIEEITVKLLDTEAETARFRVENLVRIAIEYACKRHDDKNAESNFR